MHTLNHNKSTLFKVNDPALKHDPCHDPTLNNNSGQDSGDNLPNKTQIMNNISRFRETSRFGESLRYCEYSPADRGTFLFGTIRHRREATPRFPRSFYLGQKNDRRTMTCDDDHRPSIDRRSEDSQRHWGSQAPIDHVGRHGSSIWGYLARGLGTA